MGFFLRDKNAQESLLIDKLYVKVVELLLQAESNVIEDSHVSTSTRFFVCQIVSSQTRQSISMDSPYLQRLKEWGFMLDDHGSDSSGYTPGSIIFTKVIYDGLQELLNQRYR